ncbi:ATP-binding protein [Streptomyces sp. SID11385]|nr:ATP-binding protein [Streptomyces sp. SID11385]
MTAVVTRLAALRREPTADPWHDPEAPLRFLEHVERLTEPEGLGLSPAEGALLVLLPFLHRVHYLRRAAAVAGVEPWSLAVPAGAGPARRRFEVFAEGHEALVRRARRDAEAEPVVGWWLFHRWLTRDQEFAEPESVGELLAELGECVAPLGGTLDAGRLAALLHGLRRGPDVCHPEHLHQLPDDERVRSGGGAQRVRFRRLALLATLAHGMAVEPAGLPDIVAEHVAVPYPVDVAGLRRVLAGATWGGTTELPVLRAECHHEAVVEALRAYTARLDELLHAIRATGLLPPSLPARLSSSGVLPGRGVFEGYARFRSDDRRFLSLAVGVELYKDRDLAVRELYQNALDACRYRRARSEYLDRTGALPTAYEGRIRFTQGEDEDGRRYVECEDNGVGMGEAELRGVFSHAGARFAEQAEFRLERARWEALDPPVRLYPNSRFGIGVLSYFMLAEEIRVTTCRMSAEGVPGPVLRASVCGPEHLFRIVREADKGTPGTKVRLYLREGVVAEEWSCVKVLEGVLGIAEFGTVAEEGRRRRVEWEAGRVRSADRAARRYESEDDASRIHSAGWTLPWSAGAEGAQVVWCQEGGALLVDGLVVAPARPSGVLAQDGSGLQGVVVNLRGPDAPERLSVDRQHVLDELGSSLAELLTRAVTAFAGTPPGFRLGSWFCDVLQASPALADVVGDALVSMGRELSSGGFVFGSAATGTFPLDVSLVSGRRPGGHHDMTRATGYAPDHIYLWRLLAHGREELLGPLAELCPDIRTERPLRRARATDQWLLLGADVDRRAVISWSRGAVFRDEELGSIARVAGLSRDALDSRLRALGYPWDRAPGDPLPRQRRPEREFKPRPDPRARPVSVGALAEFVRRRRLPVDAVAAELRGTGWDVPAKVVEWYRKAGSEPLLRLYSPESSVGMVPLDPEHKVPPGHIAAMSLALDLPTSEICRRLTAFGLDADGSGLPERPDKSWLKLLQLRGGKEPHWLPWGASLSPGDVLFRAFSASLRPIEVWRRLRSLGFAVPSPFPDDADPDDRFLLPGHSTGPAKPPADPIAYRDLFSHQSSWEQKRERVAKLRSYGFVVPVEFPAEPGPFDDHILTELRDERRLRTGDVVPFHFALPLARDLNISPAEVAAVLVRYRIPVSRTSLPDGMTFRDAAELARMHSTGRVREEEGFPLHYLQETALRQHRTIPDVVADLRALGFTVPDPADTIRAALARVPSA